MDLNQINSRLIFNGVQVVDQYHSFVSEDGGVVKMENELLLRKIQKKIKQNKSLFNSLLDELLEEYTQKPVHNTYKGNYVDLYIYSVNNLYDLLDGLLHPKKSMVYEILQYDYKNISLQTMKRVINLKLCIDSIFRSNNKLIYIHSLVCCVYRGDYKKKVFSSYGMANVAGPWANVSDFIRYWGWDEQGFDLDVKSKQNQQRYSLGFENYNKYWVDDMFRLTEIKDDPYLFDSGESPYPRRDYLYQS
jgi:hypothetical protein